MTEGVFGKDYAAAYDALYQDKDYGTECDLVERLIGAYGGGAGRRILDLGCGTGGHAALLAERGYEVVGVDRAPEMLALARARGGAVRYELGDVGQVDLAETFDVALMMFAVLGYQIDNAAVRAALSTARRHLQPGGLFLCDVWYGPAVLAERPSERVKVMHTSAEQLIRVASGELDSARNVCTVRYHLWRIADGRVAAEIREAHTMRYFFAPELDLLLADAGFELVRLGAFPDIDTPPDERTWNVALVARAIS